ncbi:hypothetical protein KKC88_00535 [Patescibacteria group bacterium]|nr:hypothetical protein [Patescibacteria group bacterium]MBU1673293.1 hypothetical protein [Patescibacteria group bacterium]MBU1963203.1 hypothetical protein [Patescibacteria group bacterium]
MIKVVGHRGAAAYSIENTISSFKKAIALGANEIEFDVQLTKDSVPIIFHDEYLNRLTNKRGFLGDKTWEKIQKLKLEKNEHIPSLEEGLTFFKNKKVGLQIELKGKDVWEKTLAQVKKFGLMKRTTFSSFYYDQIKKLKKAAPTARCGLILSDRPIGPIKMLKEYHADNLHIRKSYVTKNLVTTLHKHKKKIFAWNADKEKDITRLIDLKVDYIGSNKPDEVIKLLKSYK